MADEPCDCDKVTWLGFLLRMTPLAVALFLGAAGIFQLNVEDNSIADRRTEQGLTVALVSSSLVLLGAWLATELFYVHTGATRRRARSGDESE